MSLNDNEIAPLSEFGMTSSWAEGRICAWDQRRPFLEQGGRKFYVAGPFHKNTYLPWITTLMAE